MQRTERREGAFSIVEVVIAALLLALVVVGATAMFGTASKSTATVKVRDKQVALANQALTKLQADPSWATWCRAQQDPFDCDLDQWPGNSFGNSTTINDGSGALKFVVRTQATGTDLPADGLGADDKDSLRPDVYRLSVTIAPHQSVAARFPDMKAYSIQAEYNPSVRVSSGRVTVDACRAMNQVDERLQIGDCYATTNILDQLPPPALDTSNNGSIQNTCDGPASTLIGSDERDCTAFKCANADIAKANPGLKTPCSSYPGWKDPNSWNFLQRMFTKVVTQPVTGSVRLKNVTTGTIYGPITFNAGRADFKGLPIGEYEVLPNVNGSSRLWKSKSVPSSQVVAVEAGINSRAVLVFRPQPTGHVTVPVRSLDSSIPWDPRALPGWVHIDDWGNVQQSPQPVEICLVPVPQGRLVGSDIPCRKFKPLSSTTEFHFPNVEPGLYSAQLSTQGYTRFMSLSGTAGFIWVPEGGGEIEKLNNSGAPFEFVNGLCAKFVRQTVVGTTTNPVTGTPIPPVQSCSAGGPAGGPGGGGGGGVQ